MYGESDDVRDGRANECGVDLFVIQSLHQLAAAAFLQHQRDEWGHLAERPDHARHEGMERRRTREADDDAPLLAPRRPARGGERPIDLIENHASALEKGSAGVGQLHAARLAAEQLNVQLLLESADLHAERRLLNTQAFRGPGHVPFFGDGDEIAQVAQLHLPYVSDIDCELIIYFTRTSGKSYGAVRRSAQWGGNSDGEQSGQCLPGWRSMARCSRATNPF